MRAFTSIPQIVNNNALMMQRILNVEMHQIETDEKVNQILKTIDANSPKLLTEQIFATGCVWDAWAYVSDLVRSAKQRIVLIDNYVDDRVLSLLDKRGDGVEATIHSRYSESFLTDLQKHNAQQREIKFKQIPHRNHDRFLFIDNEVYLLGASVKDMGVGLCAIILHANVGACEIGTTNICFFAIKDHHLEMHPWAKHPLQPIIKNWEPVKILPEVRPWLLGMNQPHSHPFLNQLSQHFQERLERLPILDIQILDVSRSNPQRLLHMQNT